MKIPEAPGNQLLLARGSAERMVISGRLGTQTTPCLTLSTVMSQHTTAATQDSEGVKQCRGIWCFFVVFFAACSTSI